jgi:hypothetical protein
MGRIDRRRLFDGEILQTLSESLKMLACGLVLLTKMHLVTGERQDAVVVAK